MYFMELKIIASEFQNMFMALKRHAVLKEQSLPIYSYLSIPQPLTIADPLPVFVGLGTSFLKLC